jgi:ribonucleotide monophosphatase NagD (HAD superfamily)
VKFDAAAIFMYMTGVGILIFMFTHVDSVIKLVGGLLPAAGSYIQSYAKV